MREVVIVSAVRTRIGAFLSLPLRVVLRPRPSLRVNLATLSVSSGWLGSRGEIRGS